MIAIFTSWIKSIIFVVLFASFLELLLPSSNMQRFIRVIMGLFIMMAILNPVLDITQRYIMPTQVTALSTHSDSSLGFVKQIQGNIAERELVAKELYKKELAQQIRVMVTAVEGVGDAKVIINMKDKEVGGVIEGVQVYLTLSSEAKKIKIPIVSLKEPLGAKDDSALEIQEKIKKILRELYQVPRERVEVKILHS